MSSTVTTYDLITLGETMWRLSPPGHERLEAARSLDIQVGGAESNVAIALARLGKTVAWWSRLPDSPLGRHIANTLRTYQVDVSGVRWSEGRLGTYYVEFGSAPRSTQVIYDRADSTASQMQPDDFPWSQLRQARWLHLTGITPALSVSCLQTTRRALLEARRAELVVSFDLNYRARLWSMEQARPVFDELASHASLVITAARDARHLLGYDESPTILARTLHERWNGATVVLTTGDEGAFAYDGSNFYDVPAFPVHIVDRIGAGDAFDAGLICALLDGKSLAEALRQGTALAALKMTVPGDIALVSRDELDRLLQNKTTGVLR
jgi:2-dehydro-3-deoxygluconokinase